MRLALIVIALYIPLTALGCWISGFPEGWNIIGINLTACAFAWGIQKWDEIDEWAEIKRNYERHLAKEEAGRQLKFPFVTDWEREEMIRYLQTPEMKALAPKDTAWGRLDTWLSMPVPWIFREGRIKFR